MFKPGHITDFDVLTDCITLTDTPLTCGTLGQIVLEGVPLATPLAQSSSRRGPRAPE